MRGAFGFRPPSPDLKRPQSAVRLPAILEGRRIAPGASRGRKVRTPKGAMPRNPATGYTRAGRPRGLPTERAPENDTARVSQETRVRVKRWGKSPPLQAQARRHGKPHRVQGQIGDLGAAITRD